MSLGGVAFLQLTGVASFWILTLLSAAIAACEVCGGPTPRTQNVKARPSTTSPATTSIRASLGWRSSTAGARSTSTATTRRPSTSLPVIHLFFCSGKLDLSDPDCRLSDAEAYVWRALKAQNPYREAENTLGQILILQKRYPEAIAALDPLTRDPAFQSSYLAWGNLGWAQVLEGQVDRGIESLRNAITEPRFCVGHYHLGIAYETKGDLAASEQSLTHALDVDAPECKALQDAWQARGRVRSKLGKTADARADLEKCRDLSAETSAGRACVEALARIP